MAATRERRPNAGNRLQALLNKEEEMEELFDDEGVDEEFEIEGHEEEDIVDSDFDQSSADEEPVEDDEANLEEDPEDARVRKRQQTMLNHLRTGKSSFSVPVLGAVPGAVTGAKAGTGERSKPLRQAAKKAAPTSGITSRSSPGTTTTSTSAAASPAPSTASVPKIPAEVRQSSRRTTVLNKQETELKLLEYETRKAMLPKREKVVVHKMTQRELLEEAKKTAVLNLASLQAFKAQELEKKKVVKKKEIVMENYVRYHSFPEWIGHGPLIQALADVGTATPSGTRPPTRHGSRAGSAVPPETASGSGHSGGVPPQSLAQSLVQSLLEQQQAQEHPSGSKSGSGPDNHQLTIEKTQGSPMNIDPPGDVEMSTLSGNVDQERKGANIPTGSLTPTHWSTTNMSSGSIARKRKKLHPTQMCGRSLITFVGYDDGSSPISEWSYVESYPDKKPICPITGLPAKYKDPKSGIPYANKEAYKILQNVVRHGYVWSSVLNAYCHDVSQPLPRGVPAGLAEVLIGGQQVGEGIVLKDGDLVSAGIPGGGGGGYTYRRRQQQKPQQAQE
ncbi:hypothetical protein BGX31_004948 [Mortierella sp. GBA43]|nr:hypothetical protein BGX31_004948 [Mortierella sp. GBA43]